MCKIFRRIATIYSVDENRFHLALRLGNEFVRDANRSVQYRLNDWFAFA